MKTITSVSGNPLVDHLIANFKECLSYFVADPLFTSDQLKPRKETIRLRKRLGSAAAALKENDFLDKLAETLRAWGVGARGSELVRTNQFRSQLRSHLKEITELDGSTIEEADDGVGDKVWRVIAALELTINLRTGEPTRSKIVAGTKALHHLLPELVLPIDRTYTTLFSLQD